MKKSVCFIVLILLTGFASGQVPSSCIPVPHLQNSYNDDARYLALGRMYAVHAPDTALIEIPDTDRDSVLSGLAAIFNIDTLQQSDSVYKYYCIHEYGKRYHLSLQVDTAYAWAKQWAILHTATGYAPLDDFMTRHGFLVTGYFSGSSLPSLNNYATITADHVLNMRAFADSLALFPGVVYIEYSDAGIVGDGNHLQYTRDSASTLVFCLGWGDCPAGCTSAKKWRYRVDAWCNVTLLSDSQFVSDPYPPLQNCYLGWADVPVTQEVHQLTLYPNPATTELNVSLKGSDTFTWSIRNVFGSIVRYGQATGNIRINTSDLPAGMYFVVVQENGGRRETAKLTRE